MPCGARAVSTARCEPRASAFVNALYILERWLQAHCIGFSQPDAKASVGRSLTRGDGKRVAVTALLEAPGEAGRSRVQTPPVRCRARWGPGLGPLRGRLPKGAVTVHNPGDGLRLLTVPPTACLATDRQLRA